MEQTITKNNFQTSESLKRRIGLLLYMIGILCGLFLATLMVWGDLEATQFEVGLRSEGNIRSLQCPIVMTQDEQSVIRAPFRNSGDKEDRIVARANISDGFVSVIRPEENIFFLQPGERQVVEWSIAGSDAAWGRVVLVRATTVRRVPFPHQADGSCGVLVLPFTGIKGQQIIMLISTMTVILLGVGSWLWGIGRRKMLAVDMSMRQLMYGFIALLFITLLFGFFNNWVVTLLLMMLMMILFVSSFERFLGRNHV